MRQIVVNTPVLSTVNAEEIKQYWNIVAKHQSGFAGIVRNVRDKGFCIEWYDGEITNGHPTLIALITAHSPCKFYQI